MTLDAGTPNSDGAPTTVTHILQPAMNLLPYSLEGVLASVRAEFFPALEGELPCHWVTGRPLACISDARGTAPLIHLHQAINRPDTPEWVVRFLMKHELLHTEVPPRKVGRRKLDHPPEFWQREEAIAPEAPRCWQWLRDTLGSRLVHRRGMEMEEVVLRRQQGAWTGGPRRRSFGPARRPLRA
ncbi:MAG: hypothetical protein ACR2HN_07985 [Tepidiformaceae bacterium]